METKSNARASWSGKGAFILAGAASAVGLGNLWRFPYLAAKFGGGIFILTYIALVFTFGVSLLLLETALGRHTRLSAIGAFRSFGKKYMIISILASLVPFIIVPYYCIIGGWVMKYAVSYFGMLSTTPALLADGGDFFASFMYSSFESYFWLVLFMGIVFCIVYKGVKGGIEKANLFMMPTLVVMAVAIALYVVFQPGAWEGVAYYLVPDFSKFSADLLINALGQMFYSLSLAMGIMVTYGSYLDKKASLTSSVMAIGGFDLGISFIAGLVIVPAAFMVMGGAPESAGPSLMFITLPSVFSGMGSMATVVGFAFFLLVLLAALTSAISLAEACVSIVEDGLGWSRKKAMITAFGIIFALGLFVNAGYNGFSELRILGMEVLDFFDFISNSVLMPIVACATCIFVGWLVKPQALVDEIKQSAPFRGEKAWVFMIKFVAPVLVIAILLANVLPLIG